MRRIGISAACVAALFLSSCSLLFQQQQQAPAPQPVEEGDGQAAPADDKEGADKKEGSDKKEGDELSGAVPSSEQQTAARHLLSEPTVSSAGEIPDPIVESPFGNPVPGGRGLRMGNLAPPEEAASSGENAAPKPNSVEMRGLRSPSLPKGLPMDINGKLTPNN